MAKTRDYMDYLDERVEIAPANSQEEYQAAEAIADVMGDHGLEASIEEFDSRPWGELLPAFLTVAMVALLVATNLVEGIPHVVTLLVALLVVALRLLSHFAFDVFEGFGPASRSQNVVAVHRAEGSKVVKGARTIVIVAHYDTPREGLLRKGPLARVKAPLLRMQVPCLIVVAVALLLLAMGFLPGFVRTFAWVLGIIAAVPLLFVAVATIYDHYSPCTLGANDNKASVAALLSILNKVRPAEDRVGGEQDRPERRRAADRTVEQEVDETPQWIEIREEVYGVRHGANVLAALGILPASCEVIYEEPKVRIVEEPSGTNGAEEDREPDEAYGYAPTMDGYEADADEYEDEPFEEPSDDKRDDEEEDSEESFGYAPISLREDDQEHGYRGEVADQAFAEDENPGDSEYAYSDYADSEKAIDDEYDDGEYEEEDAAALKPDVIAEYDDEYDNEDGYEDGYDEDYEEVDYDEFDEDYDEEEGEGAPSGIGAWFAARFAGARKYFGGLFEDEDEELLEDEPEDYDLFEEMDEDNEEHEANYYEADDNEDDGLEEDLVDDANDSDAEDDNDSAYDAYGSDVDEEENDETELVEETDEKGVEESNEEPSSEVERPVMQGISIPGEDLEWDDDGEEEEAPFEPLGLHDVSSDAVEVTSDSSEEIVATPEPSENLNSADEDHNEYEDYDDYNEWYDDEPYEDDPASDEEDVAGDQQTFGARIKGFFNRLLGEGESYDETGDNEDDTLTQPEEDDESSLFAEANDVEEDDEDEYEYGGYDAVEYDYEEYEDDSEEPYDEEMEESADADEDVYLAEEYDEYEYDDEALEEDEEYAEYDEDFEEGETELVERPADPNKLHFDREEDADIVPRDTTGLDTISDGYDVLAAAEPIESPTYEKPEPIDDPNWGVSSYQPARPVLNIARRAALFDLPDPSATYVDPLQNEEDDFDEYEDEYEDDAIPMTYEDVTEPDDPKQASGFWNDSSDWKGGATIREDLREGDDPLVIDADDLQEAILEMGDEFLVAHDIWFVATGASTVNHAGVKAFLEEHRRDIRGAFLVNLESIGAGSLSLIVREGLRAPRKADRRLVRMLTTIAEDLHIPVETAVYNWEECESASAMRSRMRAVTIMGMDDNNLPAFAGTQADEPDNVDPRQVSSVVRMICELIRRS